MVTLLRGKRSRRGQLRVIEAVLAASIIFVVFSATTFLIYPSRIWVLSEKADLNVLGYNLLHQMVESGVIEETVEGNETVSGSRLKTVIHGFLPSMTYFELTIYQCAEAEDGVGVTLQRRGEPISNAPPDTFGRSAEVSSTSMVYTSKSGNIYYLVLVMARGGESG